MLAKYNNTDIVFETPIVKIPFGIETRKDGTHRITIEYSRKSSCFQFIKDMEERCGQELKCGALLLPRSTLLENYRDHGPLQTRIRIPDFNGRFKDAQGFFTESKELKGKKANVTLRLKNVWSIDSGMYGINWEADLVSLVYDQD
jgi:hypothetical protein